MEKTREIVSKALEARQKAGIKIRQPLQKLQITDKLSAEFMDLIKGEVNIKEIVFGDKFELDTKLTAELKEEGLVREFIRQVQDFRKELKLKPQEKVKLFVDGLEEIEKILAKHEKLIKKEVSISGFKVGSLAGEEKGIKIDGHEILIGINKPL